MLQRNRLRRKDEVRRKETPTDTQTYTPHMSYCSGGSSTTRRRCQAEMNAAGGYPAWSVHEATQLQRRLHSLTPTPTHTHEGCTLQNTRWPEACFAKRKRVRNVHLPVIFNFCLTLASPHSTKMTSFIECIDRHFRKAALNSIS